MREEFGRRVHIILVASSFLSAATFAQSDPLPVVDVQEEPASTAPNSASVYREVGAIGQRVAAVEAQMERVQADSTERDKSLSALYTTAGLAVALVLSFWVAIYNYYRRKLRQTAENVAKTLIQGAERESAQTHARIFEEHRQQWEEDASRHLSRIEEKHFKYMQVTSLSFSGAFDEALQVAGWRGDNQPFLGEPSAYQRSLILCLSRARSALNDDSHLAAWQWARVLLEKDHSLPNMLTMLRTGIHLKQFEETRTLYGKHSDHLATDERDACEPILFVAIRRSVGPNNRHELSGQLRQLAEKHRDTKDIQHTANMAAFYRDEGQFEDADRLMRYHIQRLTGTAIREEGWERLFNTYIANCIDQGRPQDAVEQAKTLLTQSVRPDHVFSCARLAWELPPESEERASLFHIVQKRHEDGRLPARDDGTIKTLAIVLEENGKRDESVRLLTQALERTLNKNNAWFENQAYYLKSTLAQVFIKRNDIDSLGAAISLLAPLAASDRIGEAQFYIAKAYALLGDREGMQRHLEQAIRARRKWIIKASHTRELKHLIEVDQLLSTYAIVSH